MCNRCVSYADSGILSIVRSLCPAWFFWMSADARPNSLGKSIPYILSLPWFQTIELRLVRQLRAKPRADYMTRLWDPPPLSRTAKATFLP
jgi:hypothetical protein